MTQEEKERLPLVTIGITCFNAASTIGRAIASAQAQDWPVREILIVDDCSTDNSVAVIQQHMARAADITLIRQPQNAGAAAARNALLAAAQGEFIAFFDDDDESAPGRITSQYRTLRAYEEKVRPPLLACYASGARLYPNGYKKIADAIGSRERPPAGEEVVDYLLFNQRREGVFYGSGPPTCSLMARVSALRAVGGFDTSLRRVEDVDLAIRLGLAGAHFIGCPERLYLQYATEGSDKTPLKNLEGELAVVEKHRAYLEGRELYHYAKSWFRFRYRYFARQHVRALFALLGLLVRYPVRAFVHLRRSAPARLAHDRARRRPADISG